MKYNRLITTFDDRTVEYRLTDGIDDWDLLLFIINMIGLIGIMNNDIHIQCDDRNGTI